MKKIEKGYYKNIKKCFFVRINIVAGGFPENTYNKNSFFTHLYHLGIFVPFGYYFLFSETDQSQFY
jgi:hypothetical protein